MSKLLRNAARGRPCTFRGPGCDGGGETTVLGHLRYASIAGLGQKPPDTCAAWVCARCHDLLDGRRREPGFSPGVIRQYALDALLRTLAALDAEGYSMVYGRKK